MVLRYFRRTVWIVSCTIASFIFAQNDKDYEKLRKAMVKTQIESRGVKDEDVLSVMRDVPRHLLSMNRSGPRLTLTVPFPSVTGRPSANLTS